MELIPQLLHLCCTPFRSPDHFKSSPSPSSGGEQARLCSHSPWRPHHRVRTPGINVPSLLSASPCRPRVQCVAQGPACRQTQESGCLSGGLSPDTTPAIILAPVGSLKLAQRPRLALLCCQCLGERKGRAPHGGGHGSAPPTPFRGTKGERAPRTSSEGRAGRDSPSPTLPSRENGHLMLGAWSGPAFSQACPSGS